MKNFISIIFVVSFLLAGITKADIISYVDNKAGFLTATGATSLTGVLPDLGWATFYNYNLNNVTYSSSNSFFIGQVFSPDGTNDIAINGVENLVVTLPAPTYSIGIDFYDPTVPTYGSYQNINSLYSLTLSSGESITIDPLNNQWTFIGVQSTIPITWMYLHDITGSIDDEFFGQVYAGTNIPGNSSSVPESSTSVLFIIGFITIAYFSRRRNFA